MQHGIPSVAVQKSAQAVSTAMLKLLQNDFEAFLDTHTNKASI